ncbi:uncharacterized protein LOC110648080 isoform X2 [Hevea brasiliensis]|uniref:uncharacterized protein LOC110648080 isoform X2 n=1 Tax=Hevea brasiliensis TaxID=3981 RepID=UPI0025DE20C4|nr:uncharacterized protein LOC110648080 isoform X2 [Hevea brasiliensis]
MSCGAILSLSTNAVATRRIRFHNPKFCTRTLHPLSYSFFQVNFGGNHRLRLSSIRRLHLSPNATSLELPLLPFNMGESLLRKKKVFVHFVLDPILISSSGTEASFAARYGCLVFIENVERLDVGALVSIRGIGRVKLVKFLQSNPYLIGEVIPLQDRVPDDPSKIDSKLIAVKEALYSLNSLEIKLKAPKEALLQTRIANSLTWAKKEPSLECDKAFIPSLAERISFTALQPISGSTESEMLKLQQQKLRAMDVKETLQRLDDSLELVNENISIVAAKLAIQSLEMQ